MHRLSHPIYFVIFWWEKSHLIHLIHMHTLWEEDGKQQLSIWKYTQTLTQVAIQTVCLGCESVVWLRMLEHFLCIQLLKFVIRFFFLWFDFCHLLASIRFYFSLSLFSVTCSQRDNHEVHTLCEQHCTQTYTLHHINATHARWLSNTIRLQYQ